MERLSADDARILGLESEAIKGHTCKIVVVDAAADGRGLDLESLRSHITARLSRVPRTRQRVAPTPLRVAPPIWVDDPGFEIANHVRQVETPGPVDEEMLREIVSRLFAERLDHTRPLWQADLVGPLAAGGVAVVVRIHHSMADGVTALRMLSALLWDPAPDDSEPAAAPSWQPSSPPGRTAALASGIGTRLAGAGRGVAGAAREIAAPRSWPQRVRRAVRAPGALLRELTPLSSPTPLDRHIGSRREIALAGSALADLKRIEKAFGEHITVNDVVLAAIAGGLRRWLRSEGARPETMRAQIPVNMHSRSERADELGNRDSFLFVDLDTTEEDPVLRLQAINAETLKRKQDHDADLLYKFFHRVSHLGPVSRGISGLASGPREFTLSVSNVPGPRQPVYVMGNPVRALYSIAEPADRHALRVAVVSLAGEVRFTLCTDPDAVGDLDVLAAGIEREIEALLARVE